MKLNVPTLSQRDDRWKNQRLGTVNGTTIGSYGCIITCMAMLATYYNHPITPDIEDNWLTDNQGYVQGNLYRNDAFPREFSDCSFDKVISCTNIPAPLNEIDTYLNAEKPVVVMVDFDHDPNDGIQTHFVLLIGKDGDKYICNDPWYGDQVIFDDRYGKASVAINQINFFSGLVPNTNQPQDLTKYIQDNTDPNQIKVNLDEYGWIERQALKGQLGDLAHAKDQIKQLESANSEQSNQIAQLQEEIKNMPSNPISNIKFAIIVNGHVYGA